MPFIAMPRTPEEEADAYMWNARRAVAARLLKVVAANGPLQLTGDERAYFAELLPDEPVPDQSLYVMSDSEVGHRLDKVAGPPIPRVRRLPRG